jgi:hypothetical protein
MMNDEAAGAIMARNAYHRPDEIHSDHNPKRRA